MKELLDLPYSALHSESRRMDVFVPETGGHGKALFFIHGGGWHGGNRQSWHSVARYFCELGYTTVSVGYRLAPEWTYPSPVEDVRLAMSVFLERAEPYQFDRSRVAVVGSSAGGHLAAMLSTIDANDSIGYTEEMRERDTKPRAVVLYCAATTLHEADNVDRLKPSVLKLIGATEAEKPDAYAEGSPYDRITANTPPALLIHGDGDEVIPVGHSVKYREKLSQYGVPAELVILPGVPHGFGYGVKTDAQLKSLAAVEQFLEGIRL